MGRGIRAAPHAGTAAARVEGGFSQVAERFTFARSESFRSPSAAAPPCLDRQSQCRACSRRVVARASAGAVELGLADLAERALEALAAVVKKC